MKRIIKIMIIMVLMSSVTYSAPTKPYPDPNDGDILTAQWLIGTFDVLYNWANGHIVNNNIAPNADIDGTKLKFRSVPGDRIVSGSITSDEIDATYTASLTTYIENNSDNLNDLILQHIASNTNPHGSTLYQDEIVATLTGRVIGNEISAWSIKMLPAPSYTWNYVDLGNNRAQNVATGTDLTDAINLGQAQGLFETLGSKLPNGMIMMWSGAESTIPAGWHICDGTLGTPDLRGKFIQGSYDDITNNLSGGSDTVTISGNTSASGGTGGSISATSNPLSSVGNDANGGSDYNAAAAGQVVTVTGSFTVPVHSHSVTINFDNRPEWYSVYYIMKINGDPNPPPETVFFLQNLGDTDIASPSNNEVLSYNSTSAMWENNPVPAPAIPINNLTDVSISAPQNRQSLIYNFASNVWQNSILALSDMVDASITNPQDGQVLQYNSGTSKFENVSTIKIVAAGISTFTATTFSLSVPGVVPTDVVVMTPRDHRSAQGVRAMAGTDSVEFEKRNSDPLYGFNYIVVRP